MKTTWELRKKHNIENKLNSDSQYKEIERKPKIFNPLKVPKKLEESLPFKSKDKMAKISAKDRIARKEENVPIKSLTPDDEKKAYD